jgi:opacity protein-like surface antigen
MRQFRSTILLTASLATLAAPALAQTILSDQQQPPPRRPPAARPAAPKQPRKPVGFRGYFISDVTFMTANQSFDAVLGASKFVGVGIGVDITNIYKDVFVRLTYASFGGDGSRVLVDSGQVLPLDIPIRVRVKPLDLSVGWRFTPKPKAPTPPRPGAPPPPTPPPPPPARPGARPGTAPAQKVSRFTPYMGGGLVFIRYEEESDVPTPGDNTSAHFTGYNVFGGVDISLAKHITAGGEVQYRAIPNALGDAGVSQTYGETDLGGIVIRFMIGLKK